MLSSVDLENCYDSRCLRAAAVESVSDWKPLSLGFYSNIYSIGYVYAYYVCMIYERLYRFYVLSGRDASKGDNDQISTGHLLQHWPGFTYTVE